MRGSLDGNLVNYVETDGHMVLTDDVGGFSAADVPRPALPPDATAQEIMAAETERAELLQSVGHKLGCDQPSGFVTDACTDLRREMTASLGAAQWAALSLLDGDPRRALGVLTHEVLPTVLLGGAAALGARVAGVALLRLAPRIEPLAAAAFVAATSGLARVKGRLDEGRIEQCVKAAVGLLTGPDRTRKAAEALFRCADMAAVIRG